MNDHLWTAAVTLLALLLYNFMGLQVSRARTKHEIVAPATSGHPEFDRAFRIHANTLEWLPLFLVSLWLFSLYISDMWAAMVGVVWISGRIIYLTGYSKAAAARGPGFGVQAIATGILLFGALGRILWLLVTTQLH